MRDTLAEHDVELGLLERRSHFVLHDLDLCAVSESLVSVFNLGGPAYIDAD